MPAFATMMSRHPYRSTTVSTSVCTDFRSVTSHPQCSAPIDAADSTAVASAISAITTARALGGEARGDAQPEPARRARDDCDLSVQPSCHRRTPSQLKHRSLRSTAVTEEAIALLIEPRERPVGNGIVHRLLPWRNRRMVGPFIFADHMGPDEQPPGVAVDVDAHPHIGLSTLTYLFEGRLVHRDSTGVVQTIEAGDVNWMTAGSGVTHTERTPAGERHRLRRLHGLQSWIALPTETEDGAPWFEHHGAAAIPHEQRGGATVRVVAGTGWGMRSPVAVSSPLVLAEIHLSDDDSTRHRQRAPRDRHPRRRRRDSPSPASQLPAGHLAVLEPGAHPALAGQGHAMVLGGDPVGHRHIWWNFVHSDLARIEDAKRRWADQRIPEGARRSRPVGAAAALSPGPARGSIVLRPNPSAEPRIVSGGPHAGRHSHRAVARPAGDRRHPDA